VVNLEAARAKEYYIARLPCVRADLVTVETRSLLSGLPGTCRHTEADLPKLAKLASRGRRSPAGKHVEARSYERYCNSGEPPAFVRMRWVKLADVCHIEMGHPHRSTITAGDGCPLPNGPTEFGRAHPTTVQWTTEHASRNRATSASVFVRYDWTQETSLTALRIGRGLAAISVGGLADTASCGSFSMSCQSPGQRRPTWVPESARVLPRKRYTP